MHLSAGWVGSRRCADLSVVPLVACVHPAWCCLCAHALEHYLKLSSTGELNWITASLIASTLKRTAIVLDRICVEVHEVLSTVRWSID
jgi:hypothetical protein